MSRRTRAGLAGVVALALLAPAACRTREQEPARDSSAVRLAAANRWEGAQWRPPTEADMPDGPAGASIRRGLALMSHTRDSLPWYNGSNLNCTSCHMNGGLKENAALLTGTYARYPRYLDRTGAVVPLEDRVNYCFTRSLAGNRLPNGSREMQDIMAYLAFISRGVPVGAPSWYEAMPKMPALTGDTTRGAAVFAARCVTCHGQDGGGVASVPAVWGPKSYSIGASMAREERAASFIRHNMPFDRPGTLTDQEAFDVAAYINSKPRPDSPAKEHDWPNGGAPADVPYATKGHAAYRPPARLVPRRDPATAIVPAPPPVQRRQARGAE